MRYKGFYVKITSDENIHREDKDGAEVVCIGFDVEIFSDESKETMLDAFTAAVDHELLKDSIDTEYLIKKVKMESEHMRILVLTSSNSAPTYNEKIISQVNYINTFSDMYAELHNNMPLHAIEEKIKKKILNVFFPQLYLTIQKASRILLLIKPYIVCCYTIIRNI